MLDPDKSLTILSLPFMNPEAFSKALIVAVWPYNPADLWPEGGAKNYNILSIFGEPLVLLTEQMPLSSLHRVLLLNGNSRKCRIRTA